MPTVLAGAIELTPADIAVILLLLAIAAYGHLSVLADYLLAPFVLRRATGGWPLAFIPFAAPHMAVHHWRMGDRMHALLAGTAAGSIITGAIATTVSGSRLGPLSLALLLSHYHLRLAVARRQRGRVPRGVDLLLWPVAWAVLPWTLIGAIRDHARLPAGPTAPPDRPAGPAAAIPPTAPHGLPPHPPEAPRPE